MKRYKFIDNNEQHLHTLDMVPLLGTTTVLDILAKPLTWWASGMAVMELGVTDGKVLTKIKNGKASQEEIDEMNYSIQKKLEEIKKMDLDSYTKLLIKAYGAHASNLKKTAKKGTDLHAELEKFIKYVMSNGNNTQVMEELLATGIVRDDTNRFDDRIKPFIEWSVQNVKKFLFSEIHTYSEKYWLGGIVDGGAEMLDGEIALIDFKSAKEAHDSAFWQMGGYHIQLEENGGCTADGEIIFTLDKPVTQHIVVPFGTEPVVPVCRKTVGKHKEAFLACMTLYKLANNL